MHPDRMFSLVNQGVPYSRIAVMARDSLATVVNTVNRLRAENKPTKNDRVEKTVTLDLGRGSLRIRSVPVTLPRISLIDGVTA